jgi:hypothetical protein
MTNEHIHREDAVNTIGEEYAPRTDFERGMVSQMSCDKAKIKALPSADVVQVVRCDDCVYYGSRRWCELHSSVFDDNAFCSYGERREE